MLVVFLSMIRIDDFFASLHFSVTFKNTYVKEIHQNFSGGYC